MAQSRTPLISLLAVMGDDLEVEIPCFPRGFLRECVFQSISFRAFIFIPCGGCIDFIALPREDAATPFALHLIPVIDIAISLSWKLTAHAVFTANLYLARAQQRKWRHDYP